MPETGSGSDAAGSVESNTEVRRDKALLKMGALQNAPNKIGPQFAPMLDLWLGISHLTGQW